MILKEYDRLANKLSMNAICHNALEPHYHDIRPLWVYGNGMFGSWRSCVKEHNGAASRNNIGLHRVKEKHSRAASQNSPKKLTTVPDTPDFRVKYLALTKKGKYIHAPLYPNGPLVKVRLYRLAWLQPWETVGQSKLCQINLPVSKPNNSTLGDPRPRCEFPSPCQ